MSIWIERIFMGFDLYHNIAAASLITGFFAMLLRRNLNLVRFAWGQFFTIYMCCVAALVFLPLPTLENAAELNYRIQPVPFYFIYDMISHPSMSCLFCVVFNIVMTIPFGMFLRHLFGLNQKQILLASLTLTVFIEIAQLTGLFFLFQGSYRLCDMDDIITNTLGGWIGFLLMTKLEVLLPSIESFDLPFSSVPATLSATLFPYLHIRRSH